MMLRGFSSAFVLMMILSVFYTDSVAMGIHSESILYNSKEKEDNDNIQVGLDGVKGVIGYVDIKKDIVKIHEHEIVAESGGMNAPSSESTVDVSPIFLHQESIYKTNYLSFDTKGFSRPNSVQVLEVYRNSNEVLLDQVRTGLGEGIYSKLVWTYYDLKELDDKIYASMVGYDLSSSNLLGKFQEFIGVDEHVNAMIVLNSGLGIKGKPFGVGSGENQGVNKDAGSKVVLDFSQRNFAIKEDVDTGRVQYILRHLTIKNIIYSLLGLLGIGMVWRMFRFFVKQDLS